MSFFSVWSLREDHLREKDSGWPWKLHPLHTGPRLWKVRIIPLRFSCLSVIETKRQIFPELADHLDMFLGESPVCLASRPKSPSHMWWPSKHHVMKSPQAIHLQFCDCGHLDCVLLIRPNSSCCVLLCFPKVFICELITWLFVRQTNRKVVVALATKFLDSFGFWMAKLFKKWFLACCF